MLTENRLEVMQRAYYCAACGKKLTLQTAPIPSFSEDTGQLVMFDYWSKCPNSGIGYPITVDTYGKKVVAGEASFAEAVRAYEQRRSRKRVGWTVAKGVGRIILAVALAAAAGVMVRSL